MEKTNKRLSVPVPVAELAKLNKRRREEDAARMQRTRGILEQIIYFMTMKQAKLLDILPTVRNRYLMYPAFGTMTQYDLMRDYKPAWRRPR